MTSIQSVCLRIPTSLKATNTWATRYLASNLLEIVKTAFFTRIQKKCCYLLMSERESMSPKRNKQQAGIEQKIE